MSYNGGRLHSTNGARTMRMNPMMRLLPLLALAATAAATQGCASIIKGSTQSIPIISDPPSADILLDGKLVGETPRTLV
ncbi:MAG: hypothetical protein ACRES2_06410, partial [Steroidobacteraceae bacterium]